MSFGRTWAAAQVGMRAIPVTVEVYVSAGLPGFHVTGASGTAAQAAVRVRTALSQHGVTFGSRKVVVNLAPADVPKTDARFDLAIAAAVLIAVDEAPPAPDRLLLGELGLDGSVRAVRGTLVAAQSAVGRRLVVPAANAAELRLAGADDADVVTHLADLVAVLKGERIPPPDGPVPAADETPTADLADVRGQHEARRALEIAAAGGHHLLLIGPPGCGKTMLARRLPGLLPDLGPAAALELAAIRSVAGLERVAVSRPPFVAPHHSCSAAALLGGGGGIAAPGAITLAHGGVLFLDELLEWPRSTLDQLREPLSDGHVRLARARATTTYPARFRLVAATNPCPCSRRMCRCNERVRARYRARLSGPLADRFDLAPALLPLDPADFAGTGPSSVEPGSPPGRSSVPLAGGLGRGEPTAAVRERVWSATARAEARWGRVNAEAELDDIRATASTAALAVLLAAVGDGRLTGRGFDRALRVARTIADLEGAAVIAAEHAGEAVFLRRGLREDAS